MRAAERDFIYLSLLTQVQSARGSTLPLQTTTPWSFCCWPSRPLPRSPRTRSHSRWTPGCRSNGGPQDPRPYHRGGRGGRIVLSRPTARRASNSARRRHAAISLPDRLGHQDLHRRSQLSSWCGRARSISTCQSSVTSARSRRGLASNHRAPPADPHGRSQGPLRVHARRPVLHGIHHLRQMRRRRSDSGGRPARPEVPMQRPGVLPAGPDYREGERQELPAVPEPNGSSRRRG